MCYIGAENQQMGHLLYFHRYITNHPRLTERELVEARALPKGSGRLYKWKKIISELKDPQIKVKISERSALIKHYVKDRTGKNLSKIQNFGGGRSIKNNALFVDKYPVADIWELTPPPPPH